MISAILCLALLQGVDPEPPSPAPKGQAPNIVAAKLSGETLVITKMVTSIRTEQRVRTVNKDGKVFAETYTVSVPVSYMQVQHIALKGAVIHQANGKKLDQEAIKKKLAQSTAVVLSSDGKPVDKGYLSIMNKEILVIIPPPVNPTGVQPGIGVTPVPLPVPMPPVNIKPMKD